jgi:flagellar secretion chaperone FliS
MHTLAGRGADSYTRTDLETGVEAASPQRLVVMLYDGAIRSMMAARAAFASGDVAQRGEAISKAISIIDEGLRPALDLENGGEIAANLLGLYEYVSNRLLYANLKGDEASVEEAARLMTELRAAWEQLERDSRPQAAAERNAPEVPRAVALSYGRA